MPHDHDAGYRLLFSDPRLVRDLVCGFVDDPWVQQLDFDTLESVNGHYVSEDMRQRESDVVWRLRSGEDWLYLYLLIEFQRKNDRFMALRMMVYVGLLYQDLLRQGQTGPRGLLPPVLPIVLYNGKPRWRAPQQLAALLPKMPAFLAALQPQMSYVLVDEGAVPQDRLLQLSHNLAAILFRLEQPAAPEAVEAAMEDLIAVTADEAYQPLRRTLGIWLRAALRRNPKYPILLDEVDDLGEMRIMLSESIEQWAKDFRAEGLEQGLEKGLEQGLEKGREQGMQHLLSRQLSRRFGNLPSWAEQRLAAGSAAELANWSEAVLDAATLEEVFNGPVARH